MDIFYGANMPFLGGKEGIMSRQSNERLIRNDLLQLLLTSPGERVMRPTFGSGIRSFMFEQMDDIGLERLKSNIINSVQEFEKRVSLSDVVFNRNDNTLSIILLGKFNFDNFSSDESDSVLIEYKMPTSRQGVNG